MVPPTVTNPGPKARRARPQSPRRRVPRAERETEILDVAREAFARRGYHAVSMDEVAEAAGISKPLVYSYFGSKEGLFLACVDAALAGLMTAVEAAAHDRTLPLDQRLFRGLVAVFAFIEENREAWAVLYPRGPYTAGGPFAAGAERASDAMAELLAKLFTESAVESGIDPAAAALGEPMAHATVAAVEAMAAWWLRHPEETKELQALRLMNFVWMGFGDMVEGRLYIPAPGAFP